jgi:tetratricopeptide (TPR) repeat protein
MRALLLGLYVMSASAVDLQALRQALGEEEAGNDGAALQRLDVLSRMNPGWELPRLEAARLRLKRGTELDQAEADLEVARAVAPQNPRAHYLWALLHQERSQSEDAIRCLEQALKLREDYADARFRLAGLHLEQGRWVDAQQHYRILATLKPEWTQPRLQLAHVLEMQQKLEDAERELRRLLDENPQSSHVRQRLVAFYERTGRPKLAERVRAQPNVRPRKLRPLPKSKR